MSGTSNAAAGRSASRWTATDALLLFTVAIWGVNFSAIKFGLAELPPLAFNTVRFLTASVLVALTVHFSGHRWQFERRHIPILIGLGILGNSAYQLLFIYGADATTADNAALILGTPPVWVALIGTLAGVERVRPLGWLGVGLSLAGIILIITGSDHGAEFRFGGATLRGDALVLIGTLCWSAYTLFSRPMMQRYGSLQVTSFNLLIGAAPLILLGIPELLSLTEPVSAGAWTAAIASGAFAIALAYFLWNHGIVQIGSARTAFYSNLTPGFALLTAWIFLGETLTRQQIGGAVLAILGVVLARRHASPLETSPRASDPES